MRKGIFALATLLMAVAAMAADALPGAVNLASQGRFNIGPVQFFLQHFGPGWKGSTQSQLKPDAGFPKRTDGAFELRGKLPAGGSDAAFDVTENVTATGADSFRCEYQLAAASPVATNSLALAIDIPAGNPAIGLFVGGGEVTLPETQVGVGMPTRIFGKPYTVTEFNFCNPNPFRVEGAPLVGGYAALQDWDGLYRFAWSHSRDNMTAVNSPKGFDVVNDPQAQLGERIINLLFMREYVGAAKPAFAFTYTPEQLRSIEGSANSSGEYPAAFSELGLYARIGTLGPDAQFPGVTKVDALSDGWQKNLPASARDALKGLADQGSITSANGEITLDAKAKALSIVSPKSEVMTFLGNASGKVMRLANGSHYQTVALLSLDGKPLADSRKILLFQLANLAGTKQKFSNDQRKLLESWGDLPILLEKCKVDVELSLPEMKVEALKLDGSSNGVIPAKYNNGKLRFTLDTASRPGGVMVYLLSR